MGKEFKSQEFESYDTSLSTFIGHNNSFCIMLNGKCIQSVKTKSAHEKKLKQLIEKYDLKPVRS